MASNNSYERRKARNAIVVKITVVVIGVALLLGVAGSSGLTGLIS
jgi:hypothetical protein